MTTRVSVLSVPRESLVAAGALRPTIAQTFPLERASDAHAAIESRASLGKTLLVVR
jgi:NADPH:quinone reductase